jgi:hypothetical protein
MVWAMKAIPIAIMKAFCKEATTREGVKRKVASVVRKEAKEAMQAKKAAGDAGDPIRDRDDPESTTAAMPVTLGDGNGDTEDEEASQGKDTPPSSEEEESEEEGDDDEEDGEVSELTPAQTKALARRTAEAQLAEQTAFFGALAAKPSKSTSKTKRWCALTRTLTYSPIDCHKVPTSTE